jgi:hypothetical protein
MLEPLPSMSKEEKQQIARYPFINCTALDVHLTDKEIDITYGFTIPKSFRWDGATIKPVFWLLIGSKTDARFKIPSLIHDYMCNNKYIVGFDRKFSSEVFKALLLVSGVSKVKAQTMYLTVDLYQRTQGWGK